MSTILIIDNRPNAGHLYTVGLEAYVGAVIVEFDSINEATDYLLNNAPDILITRSPIDERDLGFKFNQLILQKQLDTKLIVIGKTKISSHEASIFDEAVGVQDIIRKSAQILGVTARDMAEKDVGKYYPIKISLLCPNLQLVCPIYRKKGDTYEPFLDKNDRIHGEIINILRNEGDIAIYVDANDRLKFVNSITVFLAELLADDNLSLQNSVIFSSHGYKVVRDAARKMMVTPEIIQMTENNIKTMSSIVNRIPKLKELLELTTKDVNLGFRHSLLICYVASHIIDKLEWGTLDQKVKIAFVAFFHDITISEEEFLLIHSEEALATHSMTQEQKVSIQRHAINAATLLNKYYTSLPMGVDTIVKQHHGTRDGIGFNAYPLSISPLALVFIVAEEWVHHILLAEKLKMNISRADVFDRLRIKFKGVSFQNILKALEDLSL